MNLTDAKRAVKAHKRRKRVGRGEASGWGKTSGRGNKGLGQRHSKSMHKREGGQMPIIRRIPKRGFSNFRFRAAFAPLNVADLDRLFAAGDAVDPAALRAKGLAKRPGPIKVLGAGELAKALTVKAHAFSKSAREKIEKAGGKAEVIA